MKNRYKGRKYISLERPLIDIKRNKNHKPKFKVLEEKQDLNLRFLLNIALVFSTHFLYLHFMVHFLLNE